MPRGRLCSQLPHGCPLPPQSVAGPAGTDARRARCRRGDRRGAGGVRDSTGAARRGCRGGNRGARRGRRADPPLRHRPPGQRVRLVHPRRHGVRHPRPWLAFRRPRRAARGGRGRPRTAPSARGRGARQRGAPHDGRGPRRARVRPTRRGVRADELALIQGLSQAMARDISLAKSFPRIQELARRLVPWEHMGFARYDAGTNEMELVADTATGDREGRTVRFDANAGLAGEAVRLRRPVVGHAVSPEHVLVPGREPPGSERLRPLYHAGQLVGLWSVRHSDPTMYRDADADLLELLAPQLALMLAIEGSVLPVVGPSG